MSHSDRTAYILLTAMAICFGGTWVAGAVAVDAAPPFTIAAVRFGIASVLLCAWARLARRSLSPIRRQDWLLVGGLAVTAIAGYNWLFLTGLTLAPASDGAIIVPGLAPVFTVVLAGVILRERIGLRGFIGLAVAAIGLYLVVNPTGTTDDRRLLGDLMFLAGAALLVPVVGVLSSVALLEEQLGPLTVVGGAIVLIGLWLVETQGAAVARPARPVGYRSGT